jgi:poly(3-hydroxybutyrate) depolymerase
MSTEILNKPAAPEKQTADDNGAGALNNQASGLLTDKTSAAPIAGATDAAKDGASKLLGTLQLTDNAAALSATGAHEVITDASGNSKQVPLEKLTPGDHTIALKDGREFMMHVPPNDGKTPLPVMFAFSGSAEGQWNIKDFVPESGINTKADDPNNKFIAVYPLPEKHMLGTGSEEAGYGWNVLDPKGGVLIDKADSAKAGYDDLAYVKDIANLVPQIANVDPTHKDWAAVGFSQGGVFLNYVASNVPNLFPTMGLVGTAVDSKYKYDVKAGNAENVAIVNLRGDQSTLPFLDNTSAKFKAEEVFRDVLPKSAFEKLDDLAPINNAEADPAKQMSMYESRLGQSTSQTIDLSTPIESKKTKDTETVFKSTQPGNTKQLAVFDLATAQHSYPEADPNNSHTNATTKYTEFDTDQQIVNMWMNYNQGKKAS